MLLDNIYLDIWNKETTVYSIEVNAWLGTVFGWPGCVVLSPSQLMAATGNNAAKAKYEQKVPAFYYRPTHTDCK